MDRRVALLAGATACAAACGVWWYTRPRFKRGDRGLDNVVNYSSRMIAASRAVESERPDAIFVDPLAHVFAGAEALAKSRKRLGAAGGMNRIAVRTKYFDDAVLAAVQPGGQVVLLGAGMDSRVWRLPLPPGVKWFEVDAGEVLEVKASLISAALRGCSTSTTVGAGGGEAPAPRGWGEALAGWAAAWLGGGGGGGGSDAEMRAASYQAVAADLADCSWTAALLAAGFNPQEPAVWLAEGLTMYLSEEANSALVAAVSSVSARGSALLVSLVNEASVRRAQQSGSELMATWKWGTDDPRGFYGSRGWAVRRLNQPGDPEANYGRYGQPKTAIDDHSEGKVMYVVAELA